MTVKKIVKKKKKITVLSPPLCKGVTWAVIRRVGTLSDKRLQICDICFCDKLRKELSNFSSTVDLSMANPSMTALGEKACNENWEVRHEECPWS